MSSLSVSQDRYPFRNVPTWSRSEKAIARKAFDAALKRELQEVMEEAKQKASQIKEPPDVWKLERYLAERRKEIDGKYEFRSSRLTQTFGRLLCDRRFSENELRGLGEDKLKAIRSCAKVLSENAA